MAIAAPRSAVAVIAVVHPVKFLLEVSPMKE